MSFTNDIIIEALRSVPGVARGSDLVSGDHVVWASANDTYLGLKLQLNPTAGPADMDRTAAECHRALSDKAREIGVMIDSLVVEYVNDLGTVVHTVRFGGMAAARVKPASAPAKSVAVTAGASSPKASATVPRGGAPTMTMPPPAAATKPPSPAPSANATPSAVPVPKPDAKAPPASVPAPVAAAPARPTTAPSPPASTPASGVGEGHRPIPNLRAPASRAPSPQGGAPVLPGIKHVIAVGAGKGGVGKSTVSLNLAVALARRGYAVGLLDGDIYGPSMPTMLGLTTLEAVVHDGMLQPFVAHGVKSMTMGKLVDSEKPLIWRGPMAHGAFKQLVEQTAWGELDYLIIDLPPGTGDVSLTMAQMIQVTGAVVVCTPQKVAQDDAIRAARMFQQLQIDVLGVVENMSYFVGDDGKSYDIFGRGGAEVMAQRLGVPFLGSIPITISLRVNSDKGDPTSNFQFKAEDQAGRVLAKSLNEMATHVENQVALAMLRQGKTKPTLTIS
jgi:ATP-binding protein involved in chromosome partitioning